MFLLMRLLIYWTPVKVDMVCVVAVFSFFPTMLPTFTPMLSLGPTTAGIIN